MSTFVRVDGKQAGPEAIGVLTPPGRRTMVIVRPRALAWDLLPMNAAANGAPFREVSRAEAPALAEQVCTALEALQPGARIEPIASGEGYHVRASVGSFVLQVCARIPGEPYQPLVFASLDEALAAAEDVRNALIPSGNTRELYLNTQNFAR